MPLSITLPPEIDDVSSSVSEAPLSIVSALLPPLPVPLAIAVPRSSVRSPVMSMAPAPVFEHALVVQGRWLPATLT